MQQHRENAGSAISSAGGFTRAVIAPITRHSINATRTSLIDQVFSFALFFRFL